MDPVTTKLATLRCPRPVQFLGASHYIRYAHHRLLSEQRPDGTGGGTGLFTEKLVRLPIFQSITRPPHNIPI